uniref:ATP-binding protein n=1 Tax=Edaphosphingomonas laterariae TaxID=861865 RepID=UPI001C529006|nr:hypothetical protein [Sphingomonas laterariae]
MGKSIGMPKPARTSLSSRVTTLAMAQERIFAILARVGRNDGRGSGLAIELSLVRQLVELHERAVDVSSERENRGSN